MESNSKLKLARDETQSVYQNRARLWDKGRDRSLAERHWLERFCAAIDHSGHVLDLGCGTGEPVSAYFLARSFQLTGIDYAPAMIEIARKRYPRGHWQVNDMRHLETGSIFDGIISWDGFFHLSQSEQRLLLPKLAAMLRPGGIMLLTVGPVQGEVTGTVAGQTVYHASLSPREYRQLLSRSGMDTITFQAEDPLCGYHSVLMARRK
jgi:trans-aconitate methyltransferase